MIKVLSSGFYASIQDLGRNGYRSIGVPSSGSMDSYSATLANVLLGNRENEAIIEVFFGGVRLLFLEACYLCISGADFSVTLDKSLIKLNVPFWAPKGSELRFGKRKFGARTYLGVKGGIQTRSILGSKSSYQGITSSVKLEKEMLLSIDPDAVHKIDRKRGVLKSPSAHFLTEEIPCFKGPEFELLTEEQQSILLSKKYTISGDHNRMGYRLREKVFNHFDSMLTSAVLPGTVQLTPSGELVVLMRDCQVTGGYPRVLQLSEEGINRLAQKTTNDSLRFLPKG